MAWDPCWLGRGGELRGERSDRRAQRGLRRGALVTLVVVACMAYPRSAWAPPLCNPTQVIGDALTMRIHSASIDGVAVDFSGIEDATFKIESGCFEDSLYGQSYDPDPAAPSPVVRTWGRFTP